MFKLAGYANTDLVIVGGGAGKGASDGSSGAAKDQSLLTTHGELEKQSYAAIKLSHTTDGVSDTIDGDFELYVDNFPLGVGHPFIDRRVTYPLILHSSDSIPEKILFRLENGTLTENARGRLVLRKPLHEELSNDPHPLFVIHGTLENPTR